MRRDVSLFATIRSYVDGLVHPAVQQDAPNNSRHREDRYRLLARIMTDVITRHGRNGEVLFASPAAAPLFGANAPDLIGHGLFDRVHVADRPAYRTAPRVTEERSEHLVKKSA